MNELNANFNAFVNFARAQMAAGNEKAVARLGDQGTFTLGAGRVITAAKAGDANYDAAYKAFRSAAAKAANLDVRNLFMKSMVEIFGSESRIPDSVKAQMTNFGTSKPLTARRIMAINNAVQSLRLAPQVELADQAVKKMGDALAGLKHVDNLPKGFLANARTVVDRAGARIAAARDQFLAGGLTEAKYYAEVGSALKDFYALNNNAAQQTLRAADATMAEAVKGIFDDVGKAISSRMTALKSDLCNRILEPALAKVKGLPVSASLPADWEAKCRALVKNTGLDAAKRVAWLADALENRPAEFKLTNAQHARIAALTQDGGSAELLTKMLSDQIFYDAVQLDKPENRTDDKLAAFENDPNLKSLLTIGLKKGLSTAQICDEFAKILTESLVTMNNKPQGDFKGFSVDGISVQSLREVDGGSLKVNGTEVPPEGTKMKEYVATGYTAKGKGAAYAEQLMDLFDDKHQGMRKVVSFMTGMAEGMSGAVGFVIGNAESNLLEPEKLRPIVSAMTGSIIQSGEKGRDAYSVDVNDKGDVTIKMTKYEEHHVLQLGGIMCGLDADGRPMKLAETRFEMTVTIPNQTDAELNGGMPKFTVTDFKQEQL